MLTRLFSLIGCMVSAYSFHSLFSISTAPPMWTSAERGVEPYLTGQTVEWKGNKEFLRLRQQFPRQEYGPQDVVEMTLSALQLNDEPQLDHGCAVMLEFKAPTSALADDRTDPTEFCSRLRSAHGILLDHSESSLVGEPVMSPGGLSARQSVRVIGWDEQVGHKAQNFDYLLSKSGDFWLVDSVTPTL